MLRFVIIFPLTGLCFFVHNQGRKKKNKDQVVYLVTGCLLLVVLNNQQPAPGNKQPDLFISLSKLNLI